MIYVNVSRMIVADCGMYTHVRAHVNVCVVVVLTIRAKRVARGCGLLW